MRQFMIYVASSIGCVMFCITIYNLFTLPTEHNAVAAAEEVKQELIFELETGAV